MKMFESLKENIEEHLRALVLRQTLSPDAYGQIYNVLLPHYEKMLAPYGYKVFIGKTSNYVANTFDYGDRIAGTLLKFKVEEALLFDFQNRLEEKGLSSKMHWEFKDARPFIPVFAEKDGKQSLIYLIPVEKNPADIFKSPLPKPGLEWLLPGRHRNSHNIETWAQPMHHAAHLTGINHDVIANIIKSPTINTFNPIEGFGVVIHRAIQDHLTIAWHHLSLDEELSPAIIARYNFEKSKEGVMNENSTFVSNLLHRIMMTAVQKTQSLNPDLIDWNSIKSELRHLGVGKNGAYGNSLSRLASDAIGFYRFGPRASMMVSQDNYQERLSSIHLHNNTNKSLEEFLECFQDFAPYLYLDTDLDHARQGVCPVSVAHGSAETHTFDWLVDVCKETLRIYFEVINTKES